MSYKRKPTTWTKQVVMDEIDRLLAIARDTDTGALDADVWLLLHGAIAALEVCDAIVVNGGFDKQPTVDPATDMSMRLKSWRSMYRDLVDEGRFDHGRSR